MRFEYPRLYFRSFEINSRPFSFLSLFLLYLIPWNNKNLSNKNNSPVGFIIVRKREGGMEYVQHLVYLTSYGCYFHFAFAVGNNSTE